MKESRLFIYCENCAMKFDIKYYPCLGLEVKKHVPCPFCHAEHTISISVNVTLEEK